MFREFINVCQHPLNSSDLQDSNNDEAVHMSVDSAVFAAALLLLLSSVSPSTHAATEDMQAGSP